MVTVEVKGIRKQIPSEFNELSQEQLRTYAAVVEMRRGSLFVRVNDEIHQKDPDAMLAAKALLLHSVLGLKLKVFKLIPPPVVRDLISEEHLVDFYFNDLLTVNKYPVLKPKRFSEPLYGPRTLNDLSYEEWGVADEAWAEFTSTGAFDALDQLVSILYRRKSKAILSNGEDPREGFVEEAVPYFKNAVRKVDVITKMCVFIWFDHSRRHVLEAKQFEGLFDFKESAGSLELRSTWVDTALALGDGVVNFNLLRKANVLLVMTDLKRILDQRQALEDKLKNQPNNGPA